MAHRPAAAHGAAAGRLRLPGSQRQAARSSPVELLAIPRPYLLQPLPLEHTGVARPPGGDRPGPGPRAPARNRIAARLRRVRPHHPARARLGTLAGAALHPPGPGRRRRPVTEDDQRTATKSPPTYTMIVDRYP